MARSRRQPRPRTQRGFSLIETIVALAIASGLVLALVGGLLVVTASSSASSVQQALGAALSGATESLKELPYLPCGGTVEPTVDAYRDEVAASADAYRPPEHVTVTLTRVEHWQPDGADFIGSCAAQDGGAQRISVVATHVDGQSRTAQVVKGAG